MFRQLPGSIGFELRRLRFVLAVPQEPGERAAARQREHCEEGDEWRELRAAVRMGDLVRIAHREPVRISLMVEH